VERSLGIHQALKLASWVVILDIGLILYLLLSSLGISVGDSLVHLGLHGGGLGSGIRNAWEVVAHLDESILEDVWVRAGNWQEWLRSWADWSGPGIASLLPNLDGREDHRVRGWLWHNWLASWKNPHILVFTRIASWSLQSSSQIALEHFSNVGAGLSLDSNLQVNLFLIWDSRDGGDGCEKGAKNEKT